MQPWKVALGMGLAVAVAGGVARGLPPAASGEARVRPPVSEVGTDTLDLVARFDSGHALFASAVVHNFGRGDGHAKVEGYLLEPGAGMHRFARSERRGEWSLSEDGGRMDLGQIVVERTAPLRRLEVRKRDVGLELRAPATATALRPPEAFDPGCEFELLDLSGPVEGAWWGEDEREAEPLVGRAAWTHRWTERLEVECALRRLELFVLEPDLAVYFSEVLLPDGTTRHWWEVALAGAPLAEAEPTRARVRWEPDPEGYPRLLAVEAGGGPLSLDAQADRPLALVDPRPRLPFPLRRLLERRTDPRVALGPLGFRAELSSGGAEPLRYRGTALVRVSYLRRAEVGR